MLSIIRIYLFSELVELPVPIFDRIEYEAVFEDVLTHHKMVLCISRHLLFEYHGEDQPALNIHFARVITYKCGHPAIS